MKHMSIALAAALLCSSLAACSFIPAEQRLKDAIAAGDLNSLVQMSTNRRYKTWLKKDASAGAIALLTKRKDTKSLHAICKNEAPFKGVYNGRNACFAQDRLDRAAAIEAVKAAPCGQAVAAYETRKSLLNVTKESIRAVADKLISCDQWDVVIQKLMSLKYKSGVLQKGLWKDHDLESALIAYTVARKGDAWTFPESELVLGRYMDVLFEDSNKALKPANCDAYERIAKDVPDIAFRPLARYLRIHSCKSARATVRKRLASENPRTRAAACKTLGEIGSKSMYKKLRMLGYTDRSRDSNYNYYVRKACLDAANRLELK